MNGYIETKQLLLKQKPEDIIKILKKEFIGENAPVKAWERLVCDIKKSAKFKQLHNNIIFGLECACPTGGMSIDLLIAFLDKNNNKHAFIIEAKNWSDEYIKTLNFSDNRRRENSLHPQIQVHRQSVSFRDYTDIGEEYIVTPFVYVTCSQQGILDIIDRNPESNTKQVKITNNIDYIIDEVYRISEQCYCSEFKKLEIYSELHNATYRPSKSVIRAMKNLVLGEPAFVLTQTQQEVFESILLHIKNGKRIIRVEGAAGSGKTSILIQLYLELLKQKDNKVRPILVTGAYNTDYYRSLFPESRDVFEFSHALKNIINNEEYHYIVLMDEAQHNDKDEVNKLLKNNVTLVVCYDETQAIRAVNCLDELRYVESRSDFVSINLSDSLRYNGSKIAEQNIKNYLDGKNIVEDKLFDFIICTSLQDFQNKLKNLIENNPKSTVATVGLLCNNYDKYTVPNSIFYTKWYEKAECKWMEYVNEKNYFDGERKNIWVGTWWMQGLDVDYIAVLVGDDAILTNDGIVADWHKSALYQTMISVAKSIELPEYLKDKSAKKYAQNIVNFLDNSSDEQLKFEFEVMFSKYLKNYYYIMLTRGRKGCIVYFANNSKE